MSFLRKSGYTFGLCGFLCLANLANAQTQTPPTAPQRRPQKQQRKGLQKQRQPNPRARSGATEIRKVQVDNGLEVILSEDHRLPLVAVNLWYHVGPANEVPGGTGFAHLFEHMMFEGSRHVPGSSHFHYLEAAGASDINGTTDFDRTNYFETLPSNQLELALWLESDRMGYFAGQAGPSQPFESARRSA